MTFIRGSVCQRCGLPFEVPVAPGTQCGACLRSQPLFDRARSALVYDAASRDLILGFKHADKTEAAPALGRWMVGAAPELVAEADLVMPVPLHWWRLWQRRYNQSQLLARAMVTEVGVAEKLVPDLLIRNKRTRSQGHMSYAARARNVAGAFRLNPKWMPHLLGKRVLVVDDVYTTGATVTAVARTLLRAGAGAVDVITTTRVVRGQQE